MRRRAAATDIRGCFVRTEVLRSYQRVLNRCMRELDKERTALEKQEKKVTMDIKKMAKSGQMVRLALPVPRGQSASCLRLCCVGVSRSW